MECLILWHLGLGDAIICAGLVNKVSENYTSVVVPCFAHNVKSVQWMFKNNPRVKILPVTRNQNLESITRNWKNVMRLGWYSGEKPRPNETFDVWFYRQAGVPYEERWKASFDPTDAFNLSEIETLKPFALLHEDGSRGFKIDWSRINCGLIYQVPYTENIFDHIPAMEAANELHLIDSSFLHLAEHLKKSTGLFYHRYARNSDAFNQTVKRKTWVVYES